MTYEEEAAERIKPHIGEYWCLAFQNAIEPYSHGYVDGRKKSEQEINRLNWEIKEIIEDNDYYQHENAELQQRNDAQAESIANYMRSIEKLNKKIKGLEAGEVCWHGDMDATIKQNLELKAELSDIKTAIKNYSKAETYQQQENAWESLLEFIN